MQQCCDSSTLNPTWSYVISSRLLIVSWSCRIWRQVWTPNDSFIQIRPLPPPQRARWAPPFSPCRESRHRPSGHSSPLSSCSAGAAFLSLNRDSAPRPARCMLPSVKADLGARPWHDTVQRRIEVVASNTPGTPVPRTLLQCSELGYVKYAMFAGVPGSPSAALCFDSGIGPRRALRFWQPPLPLCRTRSVFGGNTGNGASVCMP